MKKIILFILALISCLSLGSCSNEEKPLKTIQLKENQTLKIDKYVFDYSMSSPCFYGDYMSIDPKNDNQYINWTWQEGKIFQFPQKYTNISLLIYESTIKVEIDYDLVEISNFFNDGKRYNVNKTFFTVGQSTTLYSDKNLSDSSLILGIGVVTKIEWDDSDGEFIYSPESFDYSDYSLTFNANTTPYELKEVSQ